MQEFKTCSLCKQELSVSVFPVSKKGISGLKKNYENRCKPCKAEVARKWRSKNPGYRGSGEYSSIPVAERPWVSAVSQRLSDAKSRCKKLKKNAPLVSIKHLIDVLKEQKYKCALTGVDLVLDNKHPLCMSLDQIDPAKGYVEGNVQWLAWCVNRAKGDLSSNDFLSMCEAVLNYQKVQRLSNGSES